MRNASLRHVAASGLVGAAALSVPTPALAATTADPTPYVSFALGCITGAAITSSVAVVLAMRERQNYSQMSTHRGKRTHNHSAANESLHHVPEELEDRGLRVQSYDEMRMASSASADYVDIATGYIHGQGLTKRMAARAAGVRDTLMARLGSDFFEDLPVIERADGSVGDVGTGWWDARLGSQTYRGPALVEHESTIATPAPAAPAPRAAAAPAQAMSTPSLSDSTVFMSRVDPSANTTLDMGRQMHVSANTSSAAGMARPVRSAYIASKVAEVEIGTFPERRPATDLDEVDAFDQALAAMDERMGRHATPTSAALNPESVSVPMASMAAETPLTSPAGNDASLPAPQAAPLMPGEIKTPSSIRVNEVAPYPSLPIIDAESSGRFLRVIPGGQTREQASTPVSERVRDGIARHFKREAVAL